MKYPQKGVDSVLLAPVAAATTARTANLDASGANYAEIRIAIGAELNTNSTNVSVSLLESDVTTATTFATFHSDFTRIVDNTAAAVAVYRVDMEGRKKYLRLAITPDTTTNGPVISSAVATLYKDVQSDDVTHGGANVMVG